ncbi:MAG: DUF4346 domain-containing protein, partial [Armatimonadota bacterium]|nr:DUF4346 domain-containing protein [Armatimonadota bacterium]
ITLWSTRDYILQKLQELGIDVQPQTSKIAVVGNLYGNGLPHLLRNLLYNPQIRDLAVFGRDRSGSLHDLIAFFEEGLEKVDYLGEEVTRIKGTNHVIDSLVTPEMFVEKPRIHVFGEPDDKASCAKLYKFVQSYSPSPPVTQERVDVPLPEVQVKRFPSEPRSHVIVKEKPLQAWRELVFRLVRFGHLVHLSKGDRQELQNVKVVITRPVLDEADELSQYGFSLEELKQYQAEMVEPSLPPDQVYTYGNRLRCYFSIDALSLFAERLRRNREDRHCYFSLWDNSVDIEADSSPCLVSIFFRLFEHKLTLTAVYRTHNALDAWLRNVYGLTRVLEIVSAEAGVEPGPITVISHSISIDPARYDFARRVAESKPFSIDMDPNGYFVISIDQETREIVACHLSQDGVQLAEYRGRKAERIQHEIARDCAISDINHALYVGRQLARAEECLRAGKPFEEG